ncbi:hypothetical protein BO99DRAFT_113752 [Aspergillus violaceofuscus CBS 115571]|uniref:Uncharacterized protein n=1 Tax=Aspergillus violaceofuscus (strain CBS 115571) TaxID=1450538 RepID=A0A2V5HD94_ASPV1|nr:hypothetical protein BO99DRAFT_113752 [Aspergillus violaceofuscus CBS 115571]
MPRGDFATGKPRPFRGTESNNECNSANTAWTPEASPDAPPPTRRRFYGAGLRARLAGTGTALGTCFLHLGFICFFDTITSQVFAYTHTHSLSLSQR